MQPCVFAEKCHGADADRQNQKRKNVDATDQLRIVNYSPHHFTIPAF